MNKHLAALESTTGTIGLAVLVLLATFTFVADIRHTQAVLRRAHADISSMEQTIEKVQTARTDLLEQAAAFEDTLGKQRSAAFEQLDSELRQMKEQMRQQSNKKASNSHSSAACTAAESDGLMRQAILDAATGKFTEDPRQRGPGATAAADTLHSMRHELAEIRKSALSMNDTIAHLEGLMPEISRRWARWFTPVPGVPDQWTPIYRPPFQPMP